MKLIPIAGEGGVETKVSQHGYFLFDRVEPGYYILLLVEKTRILRTRTVNAVGEVSLTIELRE